jgi:hypothetical protein
LSNMELTLLVISTVWLHALWNEVFTIALGYISSTSLKTSHPCGLPLRGNEYGPPRVDARCYYYDEGSFIVHETFTFSKLI